MRAFTASRLARACASCVSATTEALPPGRAAATASSADFTCAAGEACQPFVISYGPNYDAKVDYRCPDGDGLRHYACVDDTTIEVCNDGVYGTGDCAAFGLVCGSDPVGAAHHGAPSIDSYVPDLTHDWGDADWMASRHERHALTAPPAATRNRWRC